MPHTVIIGNGIAGSTCARWLRNYTRDAITLVSEENPWFFARTGMMYVFMGQMRWEDLEVYEKSYWQQNHFQLLHSRAVNFDFQRNSIRLASNSCIEYDRLVLALGSHPKRLNIPGVDLQGVSGFYHKQDLEHIQQLSVGLQQAVIAGGGLIGVELAEMFHSRNIPVSFLVREKEFWQSNLPLEESQMVARHIRSKGIDLRLQTEIKEITGVHGKVRSVLTQSLEQIPCGMVGISVGVEPNVGSLRNSNLHIDRGILVNEYLQTNLENVYAIGDCAQLRTVETNRKPTEAVWYTGKKMGEVLAKTLSGNPTLYRPGLWFNSAKFFDIEYQVYGYVPVLPEPTLDSLYWEHPSGNKSMRLVYHKKSKHIIGFNLMGIRFRQEVCEKWIRTGTVLESVLQDIRLAFFDPEFFPDHSKGILEAYRLKFDKTIELKSSGKLNAVLRFLKS